MHARLHWPVLGVIIEFFRAPKFHGLARENKMATLGAIRVAGGSRPSLSSLETEGDAFPPFRRVQSVSPLVNIVIRAGAIENSSNCQQGIEQK